MHIAVVSPNSMPYNVQGVVQNFGKLLGEFHSLDLLCGEDHLSESVVSGYQRIFRVSVPREDFAQIRFCGRLLGRYLQANSPDVLINASWPANVGLVNGLFGMCSGIPTILRLTRSSSFVSNPEEKRMIFLRRRGVQCLATNVSPVFADKIFVLGPRLRNFLEGRGVSSERIREIPQPIDTTQFRPAKDECEKKELKKELGLAQDRIVVLNIGRIDWLKGSDRLCEIMRKVYQIEQGRFQFCVIGEGPLSKRYEKLPDNFVKRIGRIGRDKIPLYYRAADVLIHPSRTEGLPNVVLEAIASGLPVIASPVGEMPSYVRYTGITLDEYVQFLLKKNWITESIPNWMDWENQREKWETAISEACS